MSIIIFWYDDLGGQSEVGLLIGFFADLSDTSPKQTPCESDAPDKEKIAEMVVGYIKQFGATKIILGYPVNMNGSIGPRAENAAQFKEILSKYTDVPVILYDERCTTMIAHTILSASNVSSKKRKNVVDTLSAEIILQNYLDANR